MFSAGKCVFSCKFKDSCLKAHVSRAEVLYVECLTAKEERQLKESNLTVTRADTLRRTQALYQEGFFVVFFVLFFKKGESCCHKVPLFFFLFVCWK